jgi:hypothetical protein
VSSAISTGPNATMRRSWVGAGARSVCSEKSCRTSTPRLAEDPGQWSARRYLQLTVDVLRFGWERLWTIGADSAFGVPAWDENVMAEGDTTTLCRHGWPDRPHRAAQAWRQAALEQRMTLRLRIRRPVRSMHSTSFNAMPARPSTTSGTSAVA